MRNLKKGHYRVVDMHLLTILGSVASIAGLVLAVMFRLSDRHDHKNKRENRPSAKE